MPKDAFRPRWIGAVLIGIVPWAFGDPVLSIAHRGNSLFAPENTLAAFSAAQGVADLVETDARLSADGKLVLMHDSKVDRTTDGAGTVASKTVAQLKLLDAGSWFSPAFAGERIPTLEEMISLTLPFATPLIERKDGPASAYVDELRRLGAVEKVVVQAFDWEFLKSMHALEPAVRLGALGSGALTAAQLSDIAASGATMVAWEKSDVTAAEVRLAHNAGLSLFVWTADGAEIKHFIDMGVDGIISNDPGLVKRSEQTTTNSPARFRDGLVAYWKMDDGLADPFATTVGDSAGSSPGTLTRKDGASHWASGAWAQFGGSLHLEGATAFVSIPPTDNLDLNACEMTLSAWVRLATLPSAMSTSYGAIFDSTTDCYVLYLDRGNRELRFKVTDANNQAARPGISEAWLRTNQWLHVAATYSGAVGPVSGQATIYLNGEPRDVHTGHDSSAPVGLTGDVKTGQWAAMGREGPTGGSDFNGFVDDVAIWRRALSPGEVALLYRGGQMGLSLGDLASETTALIEPRAVRISTAAKLEIEFVCAGPWTAFRLLRSGALSGPFAPVPGIEPEALGNGVYKLVCPLETDAHAFYRIAGE